MQEKENHELEKRPLRKWLAEITPQARYSFFASLTLFAAVIIFVLATAIFEQIPGSLDMTEGRLYSLSPATDKLLKDVNLDIDVILVWQHEVEQQYGLTEMYSQVNNVLEQYVAKNKKIHYRVVDPVVNPELVLAYTQGQKEMGHGSIIVSSQNFSRLIPFETWAGFYGRQRVKLNVEGPVSNAILYVLNGKMPRIYYITGHGGVNPSELRHFTGQSFQDALVADNFQVLPLSLQKDHFPADADMLMILSPETDFSAVEMNQLQQFVDRGGCVWINMALTDRPLGRLDAFIAAYGLHAQGLIAEGSAERLLPNTEGNPLYFVAEVQPFSITKGLGNADNPVIVGRAMALLEEGDTPRYINLQPLLKTTDQAVLFNYSPKDKNLIRLKENTQLVPAFAVTFIKDEQDITKDARLFITSGDLDVITNFPASGQFYLQGLRWLGGNADSLNIPSHNLVSLPLRLSVSDFVIFSFVFVIALPALLLVAGFAVWSKRRRM